MAYPVVTKDVSKANVWSDWLFVVESVNVSIWGTWVGTVTLQRSLTEDQRNWMLIPGQVI